jgi:hypothetical protein
MEAIKAAITETSAVGAVYEAVNECEAGHSPPDTGRDIKKKSRSLL